MKMLFGVTSSLILVGLLSSCVTVHKDERARPERDKTETMAPLPIEPGYVPLESSEGDITAIAANHKKGSLNFYISGTYYFYYVQEGGEVDKSLAISRTLEDIQRADYVQLQTVEHGRHQRITNMLLFYGNEPTIKVISGKS